MRGIILALALTLVGKPGFSSKKTYVYSYEGWVLNGLQEKNLAKAGVRLSCKLEISGLSENNYLLKIRSPQLEEYNGIWPRDPFTRSSKITQMVSSCLTRPFKFEYSSGRVGNIYGPENCPDTCINIVRGILNVIQITIKKSQNVYELQEAGIGGVCHTRYVIQEDKKNNRVSVTKTVDQNNCQEKVVKSLGMAYIYPCPVDMMKERIIKGTAAFSYKLKQSDSGALITEAVSQQVYQISPFSEPTGVAVTEAKQQLTLLEVKSEWGSSPEISMQSYGSLQYQFPAVLPQMSVQLIKTKNPEQRIIEILQHIVLNNQQDFHDDLPYRFLELVQLCKLTSADTLESIWRQCSDKPRYRRWLLSAVSATGTPEALKFIKSRIRSDDLSYLQALLSVPFALHFTKADEHTVPIAADLVTSSRVQKNSLLQQLASLGYSSVVNRYCSQSSACPKEALQPIHDLADEALSRGREDKMKLALKCIGNMGEPASIKRILKFLPIFSSSASDIPIHIQIDAIMALRKIAWKDCKTVQGYLIQILADESLSPEVRMMACAVIFETRPALPLITTIANVAMKESNLQVASFVYSHMKALSKSRLPYTYNISSACNIALKLLAPKLDRLSYRYSKVIRVGGYFDNYKVGAAGEVLVMNSPGTMFPSAIISKLMAYSAGSVADLVEAGVRVEGLTDVIMKRNIPFAEYSTYKKIKEIGKALLGWKELPTETPLISAYFKVFGQELAYININKEALQQAVKAVLEPAARSTLLRKAAAQLRAGTAAQWTQPLWLGELRYIVPTAPGLPLEYSSYSTGLARAAASVDGKISPPLTGDFRPSQLLESTVQIRSDINPSLYIQKFATMGVNTEYFQQAVEIQGKVLTRVPIKFDAKIDMKLKNIKIETNPCHEETELVVGRHKAFAVSRNLGELGVEKRTAILPADASSNIVEEPFKPSDKASSEDFTKPAADSAPRKSAHGSQEDLGPVTGRKAHKRDFCVKLQHLGCQLCFASRSRDASFLKNTYLHRLIGEHEAKIVLIPVETDADIDKIQLEIQAGSRAASKIVNEVNAESEEEGESSLYGDIQAKLKKILGIDNVFKIANKTRHPKKQPAKKENTVLTELGADPDTKHPSSSSSASSAASSSSSSAVSPRRKEAGDVDENNQEEQAKNKDSSSSGKSSKSSSSSSDRSSKSSSSSSRSSKSSSSSSSSSSKSSSKSSSSSSSSDRSSRSSSSKSSSSSSSSSSKSSSSSSSSRSSSSSSSSSSKSSSSSSRSSSSRKSSSHHSHGHHSRHVNGSSSGSSSSSSAYSKIWVILSVNLVLLITLLPKFLGDVKAPVLAVFLHGIRDEKKIGGLQLVVYADIDSIKPRMQVFVSNLTDSSKWKLCADASVHNAHKAKAYLKWGRNCQDYKVSSELVTGQFAAHPAVQVKLEWPKVPSSVRSVAEWFYKLVPGAAFMLGFSEKEDKNPSRQAKLIVALTSPRTCDVVIKLPDITLYEKAMRLPLSLPVGPRASTSELQPPSWNVFAKAPSAVLENLKAQCSVSYNKVSTFNEVRFNYTMPADCYHILAQDCSSDLKFLVMMRNEDESVNLKGINIKIGNHEVDMRPADGRVQLLVDGAESPANVSLTSAGASLWIHSENQGLALLAPAYGIDKLYFDGYTFRIQVALWMAGKMCGLCGKYDAECEQEFRMPNGYIAKDAVSFGHSWILEERPCRGACKLRHAFVKLERAVQLAGVESRCLSTEPVLRCNKGCAPTRTTPVTVGFHCVPADSATSLTDKQIKFDQKSEDMKDTVDAHIACTCENENCI
uniref:Phosvitin n=1 Tax=Zonotrichia albicollis TaxID=44394 RepID=A0A8D2MJR5_ZONAL